MLLAPGLLGLLHVAPRAQRGAPHMMAARRVLAGLPFADAREMARSMGMASQAEWADYSCPGAYRLPLDPEVVWAAEWRGWDDWLGVMLPFAAARELTRSLGIQCESEYAELKEANMGMQRTDPSSWNGDNALRIRETTGPAASQSQSHFAGVPDPAIIGRLPARPDLYYRSEWAGWSDFTQQPATEPGRSAAQL